MSSPWDRQPRESLRAFHAFAHYRDAGANRSVDKAWAAHKRGCDGVEVGHRRAPARWRRRAAVWGWVERAGAWDLEVDREAREKLAKDQLEAKQRHARIAQGALTALTVPVRSVLDALQDQALMRALVDRARRDPNTLLTIVQIVARCAQVMPGLVNVERLALGLSTEQLAIETDPHADRLSARIASDPEATDLAIALVDRLGRDPIVH